MIFNKRIKYDEIETELDMISHALATFRVQKAKFKQKMQAGKPRDNTNYDPDSNVYFDWLEKEGKQKYAHTKEWQAVHASFYAFCGCLEEIDRLMAEGKQDYAKDIVSSVLMTVADELYAHSEALYQLILDSQES